LQDLGKAPLSMQASFLFSKIVHTSRVIVSKHPIHRHYTSCIEFPINLSY
jgi:hypothetical protein